MMIMIMMVMILTMKKIVAKCNVPIYVRSCVSNVCHALAPTGTLYVIIIQAAVYLKFNGICYVSTNCFVFTM